MNRYPLERIYREVAFIAYYFHWSHDEVMLMPHRERKKWCDEISRINKELNTSGGLGERYHSLLK
jgi:hypothetical protein